MKPHAIEEYVWDKSGEPDALLLRLEELLARYRLVSEDAQNRRSIAVSNWNCFSDAWQNENGEQ